MQQHRASLIALSTLLLVFAAACHKKQPPPPPPPPAPTQPTAPTNKPTISYFTAEPTTVNPGQPSSLRWSVTDATNVSIEGIGQVSPSGRRAVYPTQTTTYTLTASGPGGSTDANATVTVSTPPPPAPVGPTQSGMTPARILAEQVQDIHFDYDKADIRAQDQAILQSDASALKQIFTMDPNFIVQIEGNCDERGSAEYNLALGDKRAEAAKEALISMGIPGDKLRTTSFGKERPICTDASEDCYARNRRDHFAAGQ